MSEEKIVIPIERRLKECPHCGGKAMWMAQGRNHYIVCVKCGCRSPMGLNKDWIAERWNNRNVDERLIPKEPIFKNGESVAFVDYSDRTGGTRITQWAEWCCPTCGWFVGEQYVPRKHNQQKSNYCSRCGQAIDWDAVEPEKFALHEAERKRLYELKKKILVEEMEPWNKSA